MKQKMTLYKYYTEILYPREPLYAVICGLPFGLYPCTQLLQFLNNVDVEEVFSLLTPDAVSIPSDILEKLLQKVHIIDPLFDWLPNPVIEEYLIKFIHDEFLPLPPKVHPSQLTDKFRQKITMALLNTYDKTVILYPEWWDWLDEKTRENLAQNLLSKYQKDKYIFFLHRAAEIAPPSSRILTEILYQTIEAENLQKQSSYSFAQDINDIYSIIATKASKDVLLSIIDIYLSFLPSRQIHLLCNPNLPDDFVPQILINCCHLKTKYPIVKKITLEQINNIPIEYRWDVLKMLVLYNPTGLEEYPSVEEAAALSLSQVLKGDKQEIQEVLNRLEYYRTVNLDYYCTVDTFHAFFKFKWSRLSKSSLIKTIKQIVTIFENEMPKEDINAFSALLLGFYHRVFKKQLDILLGGLLQVFQAYSEFTNLKLKLVFYYFYSPDQ